MQEIELYHVHKKNNSDKKWIVNNTIRIDEHFNSVMNQRQQNFSQMMYVSDGVDEEYINFSRYIARYFHRIKDLTIVKREDLAELKNLLEMGYQMSFNADFFKRETALEACRKDHYSDKPSRLHSVYLCDEDGLEYWTDVISQRKSEEIEIFKVLASGKVFKTNEQLLPNEFLNYGDAYTAAFSYWHPKFKDVPNYTNEYLMQGTIKVLSKLK